MAATTKTKTISIDVEAYDRLKAMQRDDETLSETIKRVVWSPKLFNAAMAKLDKEPLADKAIRAIEQVVANRSGPVRRPLKRAV